MLIGLAAMTLLGSCSKGTQTSSQSDYLKVDMSVNNPPHLLQSTATEELDWLSKSILEKGTDFLKSGISSLAVYAFKTACAEMGIDVRDATTKKIDQIIQQLKEMSAQIQKGFDDLTKKSQQVQDYTYMGNVITKLDDVRSPIVGEMRTLEDIARKEQDPTYDKEFLDQQKETFVKGFKEKLNFYTLSNQVWHTAELLALNLARPNPIKTSQSLMDLYDNTLGANDVWDYQGYAPRMQFIQECSFLVNSLALLGKIEAAYEISQYQPGDSNIEGIKQNISDMCVAVNTVNGVFQKELEKLDKIKKAHDDEECPTMSHIKRDFDSQGFVHISTDYTVSAYLATITVDNVLWQNTCHDFYNDNYSHCFKAFKANDDLYQMIYSDYSFYINNYELEEGYNFKYYLRDLGFRVPASRQDDFDNAIGVYKNIETKRVDRGFLRGVDFYSQYSYYDWTGEVKYNNISRVGQTFWNNYDDSENYNDNIAKKMVAFVDKDNTKLDGKVYWSIAHRDSKSNSQLLDHFYRGTSTNDTDYASYNVK